MASAEKIKDKRLDVRSVNKKAGLTSMMSDGKKKKDNGLVMKHQAIPSRKLCTMLTNNAIADMSQVDFETPNWSSVEALSAEISAWILRTAEDINESVNLVKTFGCTHVNEFNVIVEKTNDDLKSFMDDFEKVKSKHKDFSGDINSPDELTLCIQVFEDYVQFRAKFEGVMYHTLISFTEYSLEAKELAVKRIEKEKERQGLHEQLVAVESQLDTVLNDPISAENTILIESKGEEKA